MKVAIIGSRGIPARYGGFETFAEEISLLLSEKGIDMYVQCESGSYLQDKYEGVNLFFSDVIKSENPLKYYFRGIRWALKNTDIIIVTSTPGSVFYFLNFFRKKIIITNSDGLEFKRKKWSIFKRIFLKLSEIAAVRWSDYLIADSQSIKEYLAGTYRFSEKKIRVIEYGAFQNCYYDKSVLESHGLEHNSYYLVVSRLEPENNPEMIIQGYLAANSVFPLVVIGIISDSSFASELYIKYSSERVIFAGGIYDRNELNALRFSCKAYIHGHSVGGTNPSLLEAMGSHNVVLAHDNIFNREVTQGHQLYFCSSDECREKIKRIELMTPDEIQQLKKFSSDLISSKYNWDLILKKYLDFLQEIYK